MTGGRAHKRQRFPIHRISQRGKIQGKNGQVFETAGEAYFYEVLLKREARGRVTNIVIRPPFPFVIDGVPLWVYRPCFSFDQRNPDTGLVYKKMIAEVSPDHNAFRIFQDPYLKAFQATYLEYGVEIFDKRKYKIQFSHWLDRRKSMLVKY